MGCVVYSDHPGPIPTAGADRLSRRLPALPYRRRVARLAVLLAPALCLITSAGCEKPSSDSGASPSGAAAATGQSGGTLRYPIETEPTTLDPALVQDGPTIDLLQNMYEGLVGWNEKNEVVPLVAKSWKISPDGKTYTFTLREGITFANGDPITAEDVRYSLARSLDHRVASPVALDYLDDIAGAKAFADGKTADLAGVAVVDPKTVRITLDAPRGYFLGKLTYPTGYVLDRKVVEQATVNEAGAHPIDMTNAGSVGSGPFVLASYVRGSKVTLQANARYWNGKPKLDGIERPIILDSQTQRNLYDAGQLDYINLQKADYQHDKDNPAVSGQIKRWKRAATWYLGINQTNYKPFRDARVRQAFAYAIDKDAIVQHVLLGVPERANDIIPDGMPGFDPTVKGYPYDPAHAKLLLAQAGYPDGKGLPPLQLSFREAQPDIAHAADVVAEELRAIGVNVNENAMEWGAFLNLNTKNQTDLFHMRWSADYMDPQDFLSLLLNTTGTENHTGYSNVKVDALCKQADAESDQAKRLVLYKRAQQMVIDDAPWVPIYFQVDLELMRPNVHGIRDSLLGHLPHTTTTVN
jgi:ABC-type transport system substrate-binding protein